MRVLGLCILIVCSSASYALDFDERILNTFYLDGDKVTYILTIHPNRTFEWIGPDGSKLSSTYRVTDRELGLSGVKTTRHFRYGFEGDDLVLTPTGRDAIGDDLLSRMPPLRAGELGKYIPKKNWENRVQANRPVVPPANPVPIKDAPQKDVSMGSFSYVDAAGRAHRLNLLRDDQRFEYISPDNRKTVGRFNYLDGELSLYADKQQRLFNIKPSASGMLLTRRDRDTLRDELGTMPPLDDKAAYWKLAPVAPIGPVGPPPGAHPIEPGVPALGDSGIESLRRLERDQGPAVAQNHADYLVAITTGNRELLHGRFSDARTQFERAQRLKPESVEAREGSAQAQGWSLLTQGDQFRRDREMGRAREMYKQAVAVWPPLREEVEGRTRRFGGDGPRGEASDFTRVEQQIHLLVKANKMDDAARAAQDAQRARPDSIRIASLNDSVQRVLSIDRFSGGAAAILEKSKSSALNAQKIERRDATAARMLDFAEKQQALLRSQPQQARERLLSGDYEGVNAVLAESRTEARDTQAELEQAAKRYAQKAKGEDGLRFGDIVIIDSRDAEKWKDIARQFKELSDEAKAFAEQP